MRGSNKPRPGCNGPDMPTSIWSLFDRKAMEPFLLRKANDDRHLSIGASWTQREECWANWPLLSMAKVRLGSNRGTSTWR